MATYDFTEIAFYNTNAQGTEITTQTQSGTLDDGNGAIPPTFATGDTFALPGFTFDYFGTATIGGIEYPVLTVLTAPSAALVGSNALFVEGISAPAALPSPILSAGDSLVVCFAEGTMIATADGEVAVETLKIGDSVRTMDGRDVAVKWMGRQTVATKFSPAERVLPVKFAAGSLGGGLPTADLIVTSDHAMLMGDTLCNAGALVNGTTISRVALAEMGERFTVHHIETEGHEVILANGAATETFIDNVSRKVFDNYDEFADLYGDVAEMEELGYPRAMSERQVPAAIKAALAGVKAA